MTYSAKERYRDHARQYQQEIHRILLQEWDPIGIADEPEAQHEYDNYIPKIHGMLIRREPRQRLFDHLWRVETVQMGLIGARLRTERVVDFLSRCENKSRPRPDPGSLWHQTSGL